MRQWQRQFRLNGQKQPHAIPTCSINYGDVSGERNHSGQPHQEGLREKLLKADEYFTVKFDREYITVSPLQHADCVDDELRKMYWCLCSAPPKSTFITCDSPVVVRFSTGKGVAFGGGFGHPSATVTFPISPNVCLYLSRTLNRKAITLTPTAVKKLNRRMAINAERNIFASERSAGVEKLVEKYSITRNFPRIDSKEIIKRFRSRGTQASGDPSSPLPV